jgi:coatomer subunit beta'
LLSGNVNANNSNGQVKIWNYVDGSEVKSFDVSEVPVRAVKFIAKRNWVSFYADSDQTNNAGS